MSPFSGPLRLRLSALFLDRSFISILGNSLKEVTVVIWAELFLFDDVHFFTRICLRVWYSCLASPACSASFAFSTIRGHQLPSHCFFWALKVFLSSFILSLAVASPSAMADVSSVIARWCALTSRAFSSSHGLRFVFFTTPHTSLLLSLVSSRTPSRRAPPSGSFLPPL